MNKVLNWTLFNSFVYQISEENKAIFNNTWQYMKSRIFLHHTMMLAKSINQVIIFSNKVFYFSFKILNVSSEKKITFLCFFSHLYPVLFYEWNTSIWDNFKFFIFLVRAPTSICHFFCPSVCPLIHMYKIIISPGIFLIFKELQFFGMLGGESAKNCPKWKIKATSVTCHISWTV